MRGARAASTAPSAPAPTRSTSPSWSGRPPQAARNEFNQSAQAQDWKNGWGKQYSWNTKAQPWSHAKVYAGVPMSIRIQAPTQARRDAARDRIQQYRRPDRLRADPR